MTVALVLIFTSPWQSRNSWQKIKERGYINYGTRTSLLSYFNNGEEKIGVEYQLLKRFCKQHGLTLKVRTFRNNQAMFQALNQQKIDIAGGHLSVTNSRMKSYLFSAPIDESHVNLVTHYRYKDIKQMSELNQADGRVTSFSSNQEFLDDHPEFNLEKLSIDKHSSLFELIKMVSLKEIDFTLADSSIVSIYQQFIPGLYTPIQLTPSIDIAWMLRPNSQSVLNHLNPFIKTSVDTGEVQKLKNQLSVYIPEINTANTVTFLDYLYSRWPKIVTQVKQVSKALDFDYLLLGAISYQESHWNPKAVSPTGVKGLMMLTRRAAKDVGITDRTDVLQSLRGGAAYFQKMSDKIPERIEEPDRTLFALAAYNVGYGHLEDARILTQRNGKNPDLWQDVSLFLPELNNPIVAQHLKHGMADGKTAVLYVENIMTYKQLLKWKEQKGSWSQIADNP
ncbi:membrane-bound lytic murein transglycosylase MltF [Marinicella rhabdoformis]|uniref:membrane-bound lytic murein transglycosylase MltF n=1 Tax=Marinicella rhabdoformis TaxID=2580566 RepID=UPI0015CFFA43|nr:membrane-bound lytic murein transglycosylase MltF [Marinicella rhabdoformis]